MAASVRGGVAFWLIAAALTLLAVTIFLPSAVAKPGSGGVGQYMETVDCDPGPAMCEAMTAALGTAVGQEHPWFRLTHVYVGTEDDPGSSAGQAVLPAIAFANGRDDSGLNLREFRCWRSLSETYRCERP